VRLQRRLARRDPPPLADQLDLTAQPPESFVIEKTIVE
jgi:hypothetical protein